MNSLERYVEGWRPAPVVDRAAVGADAVAALSAVFDLPAPAAVDGEPLPPLWHWVHFTEWPRHADLGADGHPADGHFLPPLPERRRMFAGGRLTVHRPLTVGEPAERERSVSVVRVTRGRTGELVFVTVRSEFRQNGEPRLVEEQDIVYRSGEDPGRASPPALDTDGVPSSDAPWRLALAPDPVVLFRFSALTANAHRIHYDHPYATGVEGYPGLVVHGPLLALLLAELPRRDGRSVASLEYRLRRPVFAGERVLAAGTPGAGGADLTLVTARESAAATASVTW